MADVVDLLPPAAPPPELRGEEPPPPSDREGPPGLGEVECFQRGDHVELAEHIIAGVEAEDAYRPVFAEGNFWRYADGYWRQWAPEELQALVANLRGRPVFGGIDHASGTLKTKALKVNASTLTGASLCAAVLTRPEGGDAFFEHHEALGVAFADTFVDVEHGFAHTEAHSADHRCRYRVPYLYRPHVEPRVFLDFLASVWPEPDQAARIQFLREFLGATMCGVATRFQLAMCLVGGGANGKSTLLRVIERLFPPEFRSSLTLQQLTARSHTAEYKVAQLAGRRLNVAGDVSDSDLLETGTLKAVVDGTRVTARHPAMRPFDFKPVAGHIFAMNKLPATTDHSHGFSRRMTLLLFERTFRVGERPDLDEELALELPEIASWAMQGAAAAIGRGRLVEPPSSLEAREAWKLKTDPVKLFLSERTEHAHNKSDRAAGSELWQLYREWEVDQRVKPISHATFVERLNTHLGEPMRPGGRTRYPVRILNALDLAQRRYASEVSEDADARKM